MRRRAFIMAALLLAACAKKADPRCQTCGMKIDPKSAWRTELVTAGAGTVSFDSPRCAFIAWRSGKVAASTLRAQDYYDRAWHDGSDLRFVLGGDVVGPMGPDLVPVDTSRATKFIQDHGADRALPLAEVTSEILAKLK